MLKRKQSGRALFYTRDSGGRHEMTPGQYVCWAQRKATELGLSEKTVKAHVTAIFKVLGVVNRTQAVLVARRVGMITS